jgi:hypothetical protein
MPTQTWKSISHVSLTESEKAERTCNGRSSFGEKRGDPIKPLLSEAERLLW